eukprot:221687-Prymnesium_polylepis.2
MERGSGAECGDVLARVPRATEEGGCSSGSARSRAAAYSRKRRGEGVKREGASERAEEAEEGWPGCRGLGRINVRGGGGPAAAQRSSVASKSRVNTRRQEAKGPRPGRSGLGRIIVCIPRGDEPSATPAENGAAAATP